MPPIASSPADAGVGIVYRYSVDPRLTRASPLTGLNATLYALNDGLIVPPGERSSRPPVAGSITATPMIAAEKSGVKPPKPPASTLPSPSIASGEAEYAGPPASSKPDVNSTADADRFSVPRSNDRISPVTTDPAPKPAPTYSRPALIVTPPEPPPTPVSTRAVADGRLPAETPEKLDRFTITSPVFVAPAMNRSPPLHTASKFAPGISTPLTGDAPSAAVAMIRVPGALENSLSPIASVVPSGLTRRNDAPNDDTAPAASDPTTSNVPPTPACR
ncbi:MAG: hypothetical protein ACK5Z4_15030 [Planctomyces sp.]